jgi:hypothetical protein
MALRSDWFANCGNFIFCHFATLPLCHFATFKKSGVKTGKKSVVKTGKKLFGTAFFEKALVFLKKRW